MSRGAGQPFAIPAPDLVTLGGSTFSGPPFDPNSQRIAIRSVSLANTTADGAGNIQLTWDPVIAVYNIQFTYWQLLGAPSIPTNARFDLFTFGSGALRGFPLTVPVAVNFLLIGTEPL